MTSSIILATAATSTSKNVPTDAACTSAPTVSRTFARSRAQSFGFMRYSLEGMGSEDRVGHRQDRQVAHLP